MVNCNILLDVELTLYVTAPAPLALADSFAIPKYDIETLHPIENLTVVFGERRGGAPKAKTGSQIGFQFCIPYRFYGD